MQVYQKFFHERDLHILYTHTHVPPYRIYYVRACARLNRKRL